MSIQNNVERIYREIQEVNPDCKIVAATKTRTIDEIREAMDTGLILAAGENRVQELTDKFTPDFRWDFIGQLQTNKVKYVVGRASLIHSVDRRSLAEVIDKESGKKGVVTDVLIEINSGKEESKGGIFLEDVPAFLDEMALFTNIRVRGLMAVAPAFYNENELTRTFDEVYSVYQRLHGGDFDVLSMGMSNDYLIAAGCGANMVRIGRAIFGERAYGATQA